jgi:hypothetical protein
LAAFQKLEAKSKWYHKKAKLCRNADTKTTTSSRSDTSSTDKSSPNSAKTKSSSLTQFFKKATTPTACTSTLIPKPGSFLPADNDGHSSGGDTVILDEDDSPLVAPPLLKEKQASEEVK